MAISALVDNPDTGFSTSAELTRFGAIAQDAADRDASNTQESAHVLSVVAPTAGIIAEAIRPARDNQRNSSRNITVLIGSTR